MSTILSLLAPILKILAEAFFGVVLTTPAVEKEVINVDTKLDIRPDLSHLDSLLL